LIGISSFTYEACSSCCAVALSVHWSVEGVSGEDVALAICQATEREGVDLDAIYLCPHTPEEACSCRKPLPGLIQRAVADLGIDPAQSFVIGDKACDVDLGLVVSATTFLVTTGHGAGHVAECGSRAHHVVGSLDEAARRIESILAAPSASGGVEIT
jgi:histidinol phosphatase-like enzyme